MARARPPRIVASDRLDWIEETRLCDAAPRRTPGVELEVTFDLGDHHAALQALDAVIANVRQQIADAAETGAPR